MKISFTVFIFLLSIFFLSCDTTAKIQKTMDSWLGFSKEKLIESWGPPARTASNGTDGEVLIYATQTYGGYYGANYQYSMFYTHANGVIYHWLVKQEHVPPQQLKVSMYVY